MERIPRPGEVYRHFKEKLYQITAIAVHTETEEDMVVYQALYGEGKMYVRPLELFVSRVDREKYPEVKQEYRFEKVEIQETQQETDPGENHKETSNENLLAFLDAGTYEEKLEILINRREHFSGQELAGVCESLELSAPDTGRGGLYGAAMDYLKLQNKYDGTRLR